MSLPTLLLVAAAAAGSATPPTCVESVPQGRPKPAIKDTFPGVGTSGYAATLVVDVEHGKGETVLPQGLSLTQAKEAATVLKEAGFAIPDQDGGAAARLTVHPVDPAHTDRATTTLEIPLVPLPPNPGRQVLTLPPLPVAVARASGEVITACTRAHAIRIEDPTASTPEARPAANPPPRPQREEWTSLRNALMVAAGGLVLGGLLFWLFQRWASRPRPEPPPPPPRPPWEVALERLDEVKHAGLLETGRHAEFFDRVNDTIRWYLGERYGFDGLESTTDEILAELESLRLHSLGYGDVLDFMQACDLVKFANVTPTEEECARTLRSADAIIRNTMPRDPGTLRDLGAPRRPEASP